MAALGNIFILAGALAVMGCGSPSPRRDPDQGARGVGGEAVAVAGSQPLVDNRRLAEHDELALPFAECPVDDSARHSVVPGDHLVDELIDELIEQAAASLGHGEFAVARSCASIAVDLVPRSIAAHQLRAAAAAALGRFQEAQVGYAMALALDPDDPETLAASADFHINALAPKTREALWLGLEEARRGRARATVRRGTGAELRARLALLEAEALNDLGQPDQALERVGEALALRPDLVDAKHELGVALFNLCRFDRAEKAFREVLRHAPKESYAWHHLGLIYERTGRQAEAETYFRRAHEYSPAEFWAPVAITRGEFRAELDRAVEESPSEVRALLDRVSVEVAEFPALADLMAVEPPFSPTILGLYRGLPIPVGADGDDGAPRAIVLYRKNLVRAAKTRAELGRQIRRTLAHEIGHLRGLDEDALRRRGLD